MKNYLSSPANLIPNTIILSCLTVCAPDAAAEILDGQLSLSSGATYTSGDYGSSDTTDILYVPLSLKYKQDNWNLKLTVPYLRITGPQNVIRDIGQVSQVTTQKKVSEGLGDISLSAGYQLGYVKQTKTFFDITGKVKFGTADASQNMGTGKNDYSLSLGAYEILGDMTPYLIIGRRWYGQTSAITLDNVYFGSLGLSYKLNQSTHLGIDWYFKQRTARWRTNTRQLSAFVSYKIDRNWKLQTYLLKGLSQNTPDAGGGFSLKYQFN